MSNFIPLPPIDAWTASSLLQKAIRRGESDYASAAAAVLHRLRGNSIWRRLTLIAYEDIGAANPSLCVNVTEVASDPSARRQIGSDADVISWIVQKMALSPKNRESDFLICSAIQAPFAEAERKFVASKNPGELIDLATNSTSSLLPRAIAAWFVGETNGGGPKVLFGGDLPGLMAGFAGKGVPTGFLRSTVIAAKKTAEPITIMGPLLNLAIKERNEKPEIVEERLPPALDCSGIPSWTYDKHTQLGKSAFRQLLQESSEIRNCIAFFAPEFRALDLLAMSAFYADAVSLKHRMTWSQSEMLYSMGLRTDMTKKGCPEEGVVPITTVVRSQIDHLNEIRSRLRSKSETIRREIGGVEGSR